LEFFDDSHIQNLVNAYLENPPKFNMKTSLSPTYQDRVIGLVTVKPKNNTSYFKKGIHTISINSVFIRHGSNTMPTEEKKEFSKLGDCYQY
jgi:hypothetical protein